MANPNHDGAGTPPSKKKWPVWLLLALVIIALLFALKRCGHGNDAGIAPATVPATSATSATVPVTPAPGTDNVAVLAGASGLGSYLAGTEALPRTFVFEKLNFDTAKSAIRAADRDELNALGAALKQHPQARIRIVGYADARGSAAANATLGKERAESVKQALVAEGIDAGRLDTASGGESQPVDTNATAAGQAENRRTELVVIQR